MASLLPDRPVRRAPRTCALLLCIAAGCSHASDKSLEDTHNDADVNGEEESPPEGENPEGDDEWPVLEEGSFGQPQRLSNEYRLAEGPVWDPCSDRVLFTDVEASQVYAIDRDDVITVAREDTHYANGLAIDAEGRLLLAEMGGGNGGRIVRVERDDTLTVLADKTPAGALLNTSDDLIVRSDGTIYFTDPVVAHGPFNMFSFGQKPLYRVVPDTGELVQESLELLPNGVDLSPDEKTLYVVAYFGGMVLRFDVADDGALQNRDTLIRGLTNPDSMCLDAAGNLYVGVRQGLAVVRPDGTLVTTIPMETQRGVTNCNFGGDEGKTLYITAWDSLWKLEGMPIPGLEWRNHQSTECGE